MKKLPYIALGLLLAFLGAATVGGRIHLRNSTNTTENLAIGSANTVLKSDGTTASWGTIVDANINGSASIAGTKVDEATTSTRGTVEKNRYEAKRLNGDITAPGDADLADIAFSNLVAGKIYRLTVQAFITIAGSSTTESCNLQAFHGGTEIARVNHRTDQAPDSTAQNAGTSRVFLATTSTVTFEMSVAGTCTIGGNNTFGETFTSLEELNNYDTTTGF